MAKVEICNYCIYFYILAGPNSIKFLRVKFMRVTIIICLLIMSSSVYGQEIGSIKNGKHSLKLFKSDNLFACVYSDINESSFKVEKSFNFYDKQKIYDIIMSGFNDRDHQIFVQTNKDTILKFEYKRVNGEWMLKIRQNNLDTKTISISTFFKKDQIVDLFGYI